MMPPPLPVDEVDRLLALQSLQILDTNAEPAFDHITALAQQLFDVPIALISLVDRDRQWFKSRIGLDAIQTPRGISFCAHAILDERILIVNNVREDIRFHDNPFVVGQPHIQFYAGAPLHAPSGDRIGTLCIFDTRERTLTKSELAPLRALADIIDDLLCRSDYPPKPQTNPRKGLLLCNEMRLALARKEFEIYFQTEVDITSGKITGIETLLRWNHPQLGLLHPADFLDAAEESGLIVPIGEWVLRTACSDAEMWRRHGILPCAIAVNLSPLQFNRSNFEQSLQAVLKNTKLPPTYLELEINENILTENTETTLERVRRLQALGIKLTIDNFGFDHFNIANLRRFDFSKLKIDQYYVRRQTRTPGDAALLKVIIDLASHLKLDVAANGVETIAQLEQLRAMGCTRAQGFLFSKPMCAAALYNLLRNQFMQKADTNEPILA
jgi:EAL domain-containing protein (putative c-di-GMP-specific phosphodiesterase class I)